MQTKQFLIASALTATAVAVAAMPVVQASAMAAPSPIINRNGAVYSDQQSTAYAACNDIYYDAWRGNEGSYLAFDLSAVPVAERSLIDFAWYSTAWNSYDYTVKNENGQQAPAAYTISVNAAEGGSYPTDGWVEVEKVTDNVYHSRQHLVEMDGYNWVQITIDAAMSSSVSLNVDIHNCALGVDSWIFYGDSITAGGMTTFSTGDGNFADHVHALNASYYPAQENGGIGGIFSTDGKNNIDRWLADFPGTYVSIAYGTNDCWGNQTGAETYYENLAYMVEAIQAAGKVAVLPTIPYSTESGITPYIESYNQQVYAIYEAYPDVVKGPDFYSIIEENPSYLSSDGVHPNSDGYNAMRKIWAETVYENIYKVESIPTEPVAGDVNEDGVLSVADIVLFAKHLTGDAPLNTANWSITADLNGDNALDAADYALVKRAVLLITPMPL
ncbi:MAG: GDSL-type esterase/lipase family protein [Oscillospiraceae bacterium]